MASDEYHDDNSGAEDRAGANAPETAGSASGTSSCHEESGGAQAGTDRYEIRKRHSKLMRLTEKFGLTVAEVGMLAAARGMMFSDPIDAILNSDFVARIDTVQENASRRVQYTNFMERPEKVESYLDGSTTIKIDSAAYLKTERSLGDLMVLLRGSAKMLDGFGVAYAEQYAAHQEIRRLIAERLTIARTMRESPPGYLVDFARMLEKIGLTRNDLRSLNGKLLRQIRSEFQLDISDRELDHALDRLQSWLAEEDELAEQVSPGDATSDKVRKLSRKAAKLLMAGDFVAARSVLDEIERIGDVEQPPLTTPLTDQPGSPDIPIALPPVILSELMTGEAATSSSSAVSERGPRPPEAAPLVLKAGQSNRAPAKNCLKNRGKWLPAEGHYDRATGVGKTEGPDGFRGVVTLALISVSVLPMWARENRRGGNDARLTMADWYRFEVPFGPYALAHMPAKLAFFSPVTEAMFPPYDQLERYGRDAGFSVEEMRALELAEAGRGGIDEAKRAVNTVLTAQYGQANDDLLRFWLFLLIGRHHMERIDELFPNGYFHGVWAPDPLAVEVGKGHFRLVRVLDDGNLSEKLRQPKFEPFGSRFTSCDPDLRIPMIARCHSDMMAITVPM